MQDLQPEAPVTCDHGARRLMAARGKLGGPHRPIRGARTSDARRAIRPRWPELWYPVPLCHRGDLVLLSPRTRQVGVAGYVPSSHSSPRAPPIHQLGATCRGSLRSDSTWTGSSLSIPGSSRHPTIDCLSTTICKPTNSLPSTHGCWYPRWGAHSPSDHGVMIAWCPGQPTQGPTMRCYHRPLHPPNICVGMYVL